MHNSKKSCTFAPELKEREKIMSTFTLQIPTAQAGWFEQMVQSMGWVFSKSETAKTASDERRQIITPAMRRQITKARKERAAGETRVCKTPQEMQQYFDSL